MLDIKVANIGLLILPISLLIFYYAYLHLRYFLLFYYIRYWRLVLVTTRPRIFYGYSTSFISFGDFFNSLHFFLFLLWLLSLGFDSLTCIRGLAGAIVVPILGHDKIVSDP